jgi:hypothetical protein
MWFRDRFMKLILPAVIFLKLLMPYHCRKAETAEFNVDSVRMTFSNSRLELAYGKPVLGLSNFGIVRFADKKNGDNFGYALDLYGCGYAKYDSLGPCSFRVRKMTADTLEVELKYSGCVTVTKTDRLLRSRAILEIEYENLEALWVEDYFDNPDTSVVYLINGLKKPVGRNDYRNIRKKAEDTCGHNFGDCFLKAAGADSTAVLYKGYFIFGVMGSSTGKGIGEVIPGFGRLHDSWKPWWDDRIIPNYECFPSGRKSFRRWIFLFENGPESLFRAGMQIVDNQAINKMI